jgi:hypothetical protein
MGQPGRSADPGAALPRHIATWRRMSRQSGAQEKTPTYLRARSETAQSFALIVNAVGKFPTRPGGPGAPAN